MVRRRSAVASVLGMRHITAVVVTAGPDALRCSVVGVGSRVPVVRPVPLRTAAALARAGVRTVVRNGSGGAHTVRELGEASLAGSRS